VVDSTKLASQYESEVAQLSQELANLRRPVTPPPIRIPILTLALTLTLTLTLNLTVPLSLSR